MNDVGDLVLSDEQTIDALADPVRFRLFSHVQRTGRVHEEALAVALGVTADTVRTSLRLLASVGALAPQAERVCGG